MSQTNHWQYVILQESQVVDLSYSINAALITLPCITQCTFYENTQSSAKRSIMVNVFIFTRYVQKVADLGLGKRFYICLLYTSRCV